MTNRFLFKLFSIRKLPLAFLTGLKIIQLDESKCITSVNYNYLNKNPFRSTFWAVLGMAAELSTGAYALLSTKGKGESIAVILVSTQAEFLKKATGISTFVCTDWCAFDDAVNKTIETGVPQTTKGKTVGTNKDGELVANFEFTWSFKRRDKTRKLN
jgi:hypothetical protein